MGSVGVLWAAVPYNADAANAVVKGSLYAFDASDLTTLWGSEDVAGIGSLPGPDTLGDLAKFNPPSISNGKVYIPSFSGNDSPNQLNVYGLFLSSVVEYLKPPNPARWSDAQISKGIRTLGTPAVITNGTSINVYARDNSGHLQNIYELSDAEPWSTYDLTNLASGLPVAGSPSAIYYDTSVNVFARQQGFVGLPGSGSTGQPLLTYWNVGGGWHMTNISAYYGLPNINSDPTAITVSPNVVVFAQGSNGDLLEFYKAPNPSGWTAYDLGLAISGNPFVLNSNGTIHVFARGNCSTSGFYVCDLMDFQIQNPGRSQTVNVVDVSTKLGRETQIIGDVSATLNGTRVDVYARSSSTGGLIDFEYDSGWAAQQVTGTPLILGRSLGMILGSSYHVYVRATNSHVLEEYSPDGVSWQAYDQAQTMLPISNFTGVYLNGKVHLFMSGN